MENPTSSLIRRSIGLALGVALLAAEWDAVTDYPELSPTAGAVDQIFGSRPVLISLRVGLVALAAYIVSSVVALMLRGSWLTKIGPRGAEVEPSGAPLLVETNLEFLERIEDLEASLDDIWETLASIEAELGAEESED